MSETNVTTTVDTSAKGKRINRHIPMSFFRNVGTGADGKPSSLAYQVMKAAEEGKGPVKCGVILGVVTSYKVKPVIDPKSGEKVRDSVQLFGSFEASIYATGEIMEATSAYLPSLFTDSACQALDSGSQSIEFFIEVSAEKNPVPNAALVYVWVLHDLMPRAAIRSPLDRLKGMVTHELIKPVETLALQGPAPVEPPVLHDNGPAPEPIKEPASAPAPAPAPAAKGKKAA